MEEKIKEILRKTESVVGTSGISQEFRQAAFTGVFLVLFEADGGLRGQLSGASSDVVKETEGVKKIKSISKSVVSPAKLVDELIQKNFFTEKRRDVDCIKELSISKGVKVPRKQMATILVRKLRGDKLKREETKGGYVYFV